MQYSHDWSIAHSPPQTYFVDIFVLNKTIPNCSYHHKSIKFQDPPLPKKINKARHETGGIHNSDVDFGIFHAWLTLSIVAQ